MSEAWSQLAADSIAHAARMCQASVQWTVAQYERPSVLYRPALKIDGNQWCALYGENLQEGVAGEKPERAAVTPLNPAARSAG